MFLISNCVWSAVSDPRYSEIILNHHFYKGQNFIYPLPFQPREVYYHPDSGVEVKWHTQTHALRFITKKVGNFGVQVLHPNGSWLSMTIMIYPNDLQNLATTLHHLSLRGQHLISSIEKTKSTFKLRIQGTIYDPRDWVTYCNAIQDYSDVIQSNVSLYPIASYFLDRKLQSLVRQKFGQNVRTRFAHNQLVVSGYVQSESTKITLQHFLKQFSPNISFEHLKSNLGMMRQLQIALEFIEIKDGSGLHLGIDHNQFQLKWQFPNPTFRFQNILHLMIKNGSAKVLSQPNLVARYQKTAYLHIGGEVAFEVKTRHRLNVVWKKYGIILEITPRPVDARHVHLEFKVSVSFPMPSPNTQSHLPAFSIRSIRSEVVIPIGETAILSGMLQELNSLSASGLPGLSEIPILGHLFKTSSTQSEQTELIIAMTPRHFNQNNTHHETQVRKKLLERRITLAP